MYVDIGITLDGKKTVSLPLARANRHGLVTGSTGGGKTVTLQRLAEEFSAAGVPVFAADVKGDLSGIAASGDAEGKLARRTAFMGRVFEATKFPTAFWDFFWRPRLTCADKRAGFGRGTADTDAGSE